MENRVETEQILSRSMTVSGSQYMTNGAVAGKKGKGFEDFDYVADSSDIKSEAGASNDAGANENKRPVPINLRRMASEDPSLTSSE